MVAVANDRGVVEADFDAAINSPIVKLRNNGEVYEFASKYLNFKANNIFGQWEFPHIEGGSSCVCDVLLWYTLPNVHTNR